MPTAIFETEPVVRLSHLRRWLGSNDEESKLTVQHILDWDYYKERMRNTVQKLLIIPAALQG